MPRLTLTLAETTRAFGEALRGTVRLDSDADLGIRSLTVTIFLTQAESPLRARAAPGRHVHVLGPRTIPAGTHEWPFEVAPPAGPATYEGKLFHVAWEALAELGLADGSALTVSAPFRLVPAPGHVVAVGSLAYSPPPPIPEPVEAGCQGSLVILSAVVWSGFAFAYLWTIVLLVTSWRQVLAARHATALLSGTFVVLTSVAGLVALIRLGLPWRARRRLGEVKADVSPTEVGLGETVTVRVRFRARKPVQIDPRLALVGTERCNHGVSERWRVEVALEGCREAFPGDEAVLEAIVRIPEDAAPSYIDATRRLEWRLEVALDLAGRPGWSRSLGLLAVPRGCRARFHA